MHGRNRLTPSHIFSMFRAFFACHVQPARPKDILTGAGKTRVMVLFKGDLHA